METKYIFVTGGVCSGLGKGITAASIGRILKSRGYSVINQKLDPYVNVDPGTMNPVEHGEVFVTDDGAETDLDLGHYERFTDESLTANSSVTTGKIYKEVIDKERRGDYLGKTVQVIPHITNEIKRRIYLVGQDKDIVIVELGGTIGDIEGLPFVEAIRQIGIEHPGDVAYVHVTLLPFISGSNELKTKPTQHSVKELQSLGIRPDILVCRCDTDMNDSIRKKLALFCSIKPENIIQNRTVSNLYEVPIMLDNERITLALEERLGLGHTCDVLLWHDLIEKIHKSQLGKVVNVAIVGKYTSLEDSYLSVTESLRHAGYYSGCNVKVSYVYSENIVDDKSAKIILKDYDAILVPGGFGDRGIEGMINAIKYARENNIPFLGICLGMQLSVIEFARNALKITDANSEEFNSLCENPVIHIMEEQRQIDTKGGTMRLGQYPCVLDRDSLVYSKYLKFYDQSPIYERHRHRYEYNNKYKDRLESQGLKCVGYSPDGKLVEVIENKNNKYFVGCQFHPEFKSRPDKPHPLFVGLIEACLNK